MPRESVLGPLFFLIYINNLPDNLESICNIFADDAILFYKAFDKHVCCATLNKDFELIDNLAFQWKMQFNPDRNKQAQELYFYKKADNQKSQDLPFKKNNVASCPSVKHLGMLFDSRLNFNEHVQSKTNKCYTIIGLIKKSSMPLLCGSFIQHLRNEEISVIKLRKKERSNDIFAGGFFLYYRGLNSIILNNFKKKKNSENVTANSRSSD